MCFAPVGHRNYTNLILIVEHTRLQMDLDKVEQLEGKITSELDGLKQKIDNMTKVCSILGFSVMSTSNYSRVRVVELLFYFVVLYMFGLCTQKPLVLLSSDIHFVNTISNTTIFCGFFL